MRARGQGVLTLAVVAAVLTAGIAFDRLGPKAVGAAQPGRAPSGAWFCPHGGGAGWKTELDLVNPGPTDATVRITKLGTGAPRQPSIFTLSAGSEVRQDTSGHDRGAATFVEYFGGWIAAAWTAVAGGKEVGVAAEPCAPRASEVWYAADNTTQLGQDAYLVVMNPFASTAVFDVALFTTDRAPIRDSKLSDVSLRPHRSVALRLNPYVADEEAVTAEVNITSGRAAVASLGVTKDRGVRSALAWPGTATQAFLPVASGSGQSQIAVAVPGTVGVAFDVTLLSDQPVKPVEGLVAASQDPQTSRVYPLITNGPSAAFVQAQGGGQIVAALRSIGIGGDTATTGGATSTAARWLVMPMGGETSSTSALVLVNPGAEPVDVTLHLVGPPGASASADVIVTVPAMSTVAAPPDLLASAPGAGVLVTSGGGGIVAMGASRSVPRPGITGYALSMGVPVPDSP
jgi:Family of unknown function (DUF5719)